MKRVPWYRPWRTALTFGHHTRAECLSRPGQWCRGIGNHPGRCGECPTRRHER